jgi:hypothetical protein
LGEVGVHHGKLFILLQLMVRADEQSFAIDGLEDQHLNIDQSGKGGLEIFSRNVKRYGCGKDKVHVIQSCSSELKPEDIISQSGRARIFSIDGGHTAPLTLNDMRVAYECLARGGIVILDDFFNPCWLGASEGAYQYLELF